MSCTAKENVACEEHTSAKQFNNVRAVPNRYWARVRNTTQALTLSQEDCVQQLNIYSLDDDDTCSKIFSFVWLYPHVLSGALEASAEGRLFYQHYNLAT